MPTLEQVREHRRVMKGLGLDHWGKHDHRFCDNKIDISYIPPMFSMSTTFTIKTPLKNIKSFKNRYSWIDGEELEYKLKSRRFLTKRRNK